MGPTALDTSVVLRLLVGEPKEQAAQARQALESCNAQGVAPIVSDLVLAEAYHALVYHYEVDKEDARQALSAMATSGAIVLDPPEAIAALAPAAGAGVVDRLIIQRAKCSGATLLTFDRAMAAACPAGGAAAWRLGSKDKGKG